VTQQEQREMPQICDDVVFDLRRQGYDWASNAHVLLVRFPDVQTMLRSLDGEQNLRRSKRFEMKQKDDFRHCDQHSLCWEFEEYTEYRAGASFFDKHKEWKEALKYDEHISGMNLYQAAASSDAEGVKRVLKSKVRLTDVSESGETALHVLAAGGDSESMRLLLGELKDDKERKAYPKQFKDDDERQGYVNRSNKESKTPLHTSIFHGQDEITKMLLGAKASVNSSDGEGLTPLHIAGTEGMAMMLLQSKAEVDKKSHKGQTPLHMARTTGVATMLLQSKAEVDKEDNHCGTPLREAILACGRHDIVNLLLGANASVNSSDGEGKTPLHIASAYGRDEVAKLLLGANASVNSLDGEGRTPLHAASDSGRDEVVKLLLGANASANSSDGKGGTPLHLASNYGRYGVTKLLLEANASVNSSDGKGLTPIDNARELGDSCFFKLLTERQ